MSCGRGEVAPELGVVARGAGHEGLGARLAVSGAGAGEGGGAGGGVGCGVGEQGGVGEGPRSSVGVVVFRGRGHRLFRWGEVGAGVLRD